MNNNIYIGYKWYVPKEEYDATEKLMLEQDKIIRELEKKITEALDYIEIIENNESYGVKEKDYLNLIDILKGDSNE